MGTHRGYELKVEIDETSDVNYHEVRHELNQAVDGTSDAIPALRHFFVDQLGVDPEAFDKMPVSLVAPLLRVTMEALHIRQTYKEQGWPFSFVIGPFHWEVNE